MTQYQDLSLLLDIPSAHKKILDRVSPKTKVLEIGTNTGYMSQHLSEILFCEVTGIELDPIALEKAKPFLTRSLNINVNNIVLLDEKLKNEYFDYIILSDVLEHLIPTIAILNILSKKLTKTGKILISMPNASHNLMLMSLLKNDFSYTNKGFFDKTHVRFFTSQSFSQLINQTPLVITDYDYTYMTPEYENVSHNNYEKFSLLEKEVLLRHKNGHFFQNIFILMNKNSINAETLNPITDIDAYWFDNVTVSSDHEIFTINVFDQKVLIEIPINSSVLSLKPTMRLRGIKNVQILNNDTLDPIAVDMSEFILIENIYYSFNDAEIHINLHNHTCPIIDKLTIKFEYIDVSESILKDIFKKAANVKVKNENSY